MCIRDRGWSGGRGGRVPLPSPTGYPSLCISLNTRSPTVLVSEVAPPGADMWLDLCSRRGRDPAVHHGLTQPPSGAFPLCGPQITTPESGVTSLHSRPHLLPRPGLCLSPHKAAAGFSVVRLSPECPSSPRGCPGPSLGPPVSQQLEPGSRWPGVLPVCPWAASSSHGVCGRL